MYIKIPTFFTCLLVSVSCAQDSDDSSTPSPVVKKARLQESSFLDLDQLSKPLETPKLGTVSCCQGGDDISATSTGVKRISPKRPLFLSIDQLSKPLVSPKRDMDKITYLTYGENANVIQATSLKIKTVTSPLFPLTSGNAGKMKALNDINSRSVQVFSKAIALKIKVLQG